MLSPQTSTALWVLRGRASSSIQSGLKKAGDLWHGVRWLVTAFDGRIYSPAMNSLWRRPKAKWISPWKAATSRRTPYRSVS